MDNAQQLTEGARTILNAASELFARDGFDAVSVGAIAEHAGVSKSNVFHHFASKEELILAVLRDAGRPHAEFAEQLLDEAGSVRDKLYKLIEFEVMTVTGNRRNQRLVSLALAIHNCDNGQRFAERIFQRNFRAVTALFEQGQRSGELRGDIDARVAAIMLAGTHEVMLRFANLIPDEGQPAQNSPHCYADTVFKVLIEGMLATRSRSANTPRHKELP